MFCLRDVGWRLVLTSVGVPPSRSSRPQHVCLLPMASPVLILTWGSRASASHCAEGFRGALRPHQCGTSPTSLSYRGYALFLHRLTLFRCRPSRTTSAWSQRAYGGQHVSWGRWLPVGAGPSLNPDKTEVLLLDAETHQIWPYVCANPAFLLPRCPDVGPGRVPRLALAC